MMLRVRRLLFFFPFLCIAPAWAQASTTPLQYDLKPRPKPPCNSQSGECVDSNEEERRRYLSGCDSCAAVTLWPGDSALHSAVRISQGTELQLEAESLLLRHRRSLLYFYSGLGLGAGIAAGGVWAAPKTYCFFNTRSSASGDSGAPLEGSQSCRMGALNWGVVISGMVVAVAGASLYYWLRPRIPELAKWVNTWNARFPERPFLEWENPRR